MAILGSGVSGKGTKKLLDRLNWKSKIFDEKGVLLNFSRLKECSLVVASPGFSPDHPWIHLVQQLNFLLLGEIFCILLFARASHRGNWYEWKDYTFFINFHVFKNGQESAGGEHGVSLISTFIRVNRSERKCDFGN